MTRAASATHLVLGGTAGIGYAYAEHCAANRGALRLVARTAAGLQDATNRLLSAGAEEVESISGDLGDSTFRLRLRQQLSIAGAPPLRSLLIGGPSPPAGSWAECSTPDLDAGYDVCIRYPFEMLQWALGGAMAPGGEVIVLSSSTSNESPQASPFFVSALFRRALDQLAELWRTRFEAAGLTLTIWRPRVVVTRLSLAYAQRLTGVASVDEQTSFLARSFNVAHVPSASEYVRASLALGKGRRA